MHPQSKIFSENKMLNKVILQGKGCMNNSIIILFVFHFKVYLEIA